MDDSNAGSVAPAAPHNSNGDVAPRNIKRDAAVALEKAQNHFDIVLSREEKTVHGVRERFKSHVTDEKADALLDTMQQYEHRTAAAIRALQAIAKDGIDGLPDNDRAVHSRALVGYDRFCADIRPQHIVSKKASRPIVDFIQAYKSPLFMASVAHGASPANNGNGVARSA